MTKTSYLIRFFLCFYIFQTFFSHPGIVQGAELKNKPEDTMTAYFNALKNGDIQKLISLLDDPLLRDKRELFEEDDTYPDFLRNYYQDAFMVITESTLTDDNNNCILTTNIFFNSSGNPLVIQFFLKNTDHGWKITHESSIP